MARLSRLVAAGFGLGWMSFASGTAASLAATLVGARMPRGRLAAFAALATAGGWVAVRRAVPEPDADPGWVVVDEVAGQWIALLGSPRGSTVGAAVAFALFRVLDITKRGPVGWAERRGGAFGVMADDVVAGVLAAGVLAAARRATPGWRGVAMVGQDTLDEAAALLDLLRARGLTVATAESCTGGLIAAALTSVAGSSDVVERGFVTYSNAAKTAMLGVPAELIAAQGAVSEAVALRMATGALERSPADLAVAVTGIAGPGGGSPEKPVGLVWFGAGRRGNPAWAAREVFPGDRTAVREATVRRALQILRQLAGTSAACWLMSVLATCHP